MNHLLERISKIAKEAELPALLIGGHAVTALGCPRSTFDIDLLIPRAHSKQWADELSKLHYHSFHETANFLQLESAPDLPLPPIDLMLVSDEIFEHLSQSQVNSVPLPTPSVIQLIALKLHALNQPSRREAHKDWGDIFSLIEAHSLSLDNSDFNGIVLKYGGERAVERIKRHLG